MFSDKNVENRQTGNKEIWFYMLVKTGEKATNAAGAALLFFLASGLAVFAARKTKERK